MAPPPPHQPFDVSRLLILLCTVCAVPALAVGQGPRLDNLRPRLPAGQGGVVACITPDLNGDGLADLVRASAEDFGVWLQDSAGRFEAARVPKQLPTSAAEIVALAVGRITSPSSTDVLVGYRSGLVQVYANVAGVFGKMVAMPPIAGAFQPALEQILVGDIDQTVNRLDEVVLLLDRERPVVMTPDSTGAFSQVMLIGQRMGMPRGQLVDLDMDKDLDLLIVTAEPTPRLPGLYLNTGTVLRIDFTAFGLKFLTANQLVTVDVAGSSAPELFMTPTDTMPTAVRVFQNTSTVPGKPSFSLVAIPATAYTVSSPRDFDVADVNNDGYLDLLAVSEDGAVTHGLSGGPSSRMSFASAVEILPASERQAVCAVDLEGDGDTDLLVAGNGIEDSLLLGAPNALPDPEVDTEAQGIPIQCTDRYLIEAVDLTGEGDLDLAIWSATGGSAPVLLRNIDGQARFDEIAYTGQIPALPSSSYRSIQGAQVDGPGGAGCLVLGSVTSANSTGVRVWVKGAKAVLDDVSLSRWKIRRGFDSIVAGDLSGRLKGSIGSAGYSDVVGVDSYGRLRIVYNRQGVYDRESVVSYSAVDLGSKVVTSDLNLDGSLDILIFQPRGKVRIFLADNSKADRYVEKASLSYSSREALARDMTGDLIPDLLISAPAQPTGLIFLKGRGDGAFVDRTGVILPKVLSTKAAVTQMAFLEGESIGSHSVVLGFAAEQDQILRATNSIFNAPEDLPVRGSRNTRQFLTSDLDLDGDQDLVIARSDTLPALLLGQRTDFCNVGLGQAGREGLIHIAYPDVATLGGIAIGFPSTRVDLGSMGILRLGRMSVILMVAPTGGLQQQLRLPLPATLSPMQIPMQLITAQGNALRFAKQDNFRPTGR